MRKNFNKAFEALRGNRGSGIVMVLVCIMCVSMLGTLLLCLSYTGFMIKATDRQSKTDMYDATAAMDEIRAGLQLATSDSIAQAYKTALINYSNPAYVSGTTMEKKFQSEFVDNLKNWKNSEGKALLQSKGLANGVYNIDLLKAFTQADVTSKSGGIASFSGKSITLKGVCVTYTDSKGYTTSVTSDIDITAPSFNYVVSNYSVSGLQSYALIAKTALETTATGENTVTGSAYAGNINISNTTTINNGTIICKNTVNTISDRGNLIMDSEVNLWAKRLEVKSGAMLTLKGNSYIYDDLDLAGKGAKAYMSGNYYGFGNSDTNAKESSAIVVNGRETILNMSGLSQLMLAGHSFISDSNMNAIKSSEIITGESLSVKENQRVYLVPISCLDGAVTNPLAYSGNQPVVTLKEGATINNHALSYYGISLKEVYANYPGAADQHRAYYFMQFDTSDHANEFFKDYFNGNKSTIADYLKAYTTLTNATGTVKSEGYALKTTADGCQIIPLAGEFSTSSQQMISTFNQLTTTLFEPEKDKYDDPYEYFADSEKISTITANTPIYFGTSGVVVNGNYVIDGSNSGLRVVIASGNVNVNSQFTGLIISGGTITLAQGATVKADDAGVTAAFAATDTTGTALGAYLRHGASETGKTENPGSNTGWNMDKLVSYKNWKKN